MICCIEEDLPVISRMFSSCCHTLFITSLGLLLVRRHVIELAERGHAWIHQVELSRKSRPACIYSRKIQITPGRGRNASGHPGRQRCVWDTHHVTDHISLLSLISGDLPFFKHLPATPDVNSCNVGLLQSVPWFGPAAPAWDATSLSHKPLRLTCRTSG